MNRTTVKRGIGAVILALIAAALLAFLLKDKAAQRQEVVEIALPGTEGSTETSDQSTRLPTLTTDNSGNGSVIANAGSGSGNDAINSASGNANTANGAAGTTTASGSGSDSDGTIIASAAAVGATAAGVASATAGAATDASKSVDFSVKPRAASSKASSEFLDLDLVNNGQSNASAPAASSTTTATTAAVAATTTAAAQQVQTAAPESTASTDQGIVIASTGARSSGNSSANVTQPRLIGEKRSAPVKSARTAKVITRQASTRSQTGTTGQAKNGYAIQLLATSSLTRANNLKKVMSGEGYSTYVTKTKQNGKTLHRVRIGHYKTKSQAVNAQAAMKRRYKKNTNVNRSAVVAR